MPAAPDSAGFSSAWTSGRSAALGPPLGGNIAAEPDCAMASPAAGRAAAPGTRDDLPPADLARGCGHGQFQPCRRRAPDQARERLPGALAHGLLGQQLRQGGRPILKAWRSRRDWRKRPGAHRRRSAPAWGRASRAPSRSSGARAVALPRRGRAPPRQAGQARSDPASRSPSRPPAAFPLTTTGREASHIMTAGRLSGKGVRLAAQPCSAALRIVTVSAATRAAAERGKYSMLFLTRKVGESIVINDNIEAHRCGGSRASSIKLGFTFPPEAKVLRRELHDRIKAEAANRPHGADGNRQRGRGSDRDV